MNIGIKCRRIGLNDRMHPILRCEQWSKYWSDLCQDITSNDARTSIRRDEDPSDEDTIRMHSDEEILTR